MQEIAQLPTAQSTVLAVSNLGKEYKLYASPRQRLKALLTGRATHRSHWALQGVSFTLQRGQCMGVIGANGAGKSTLLKLLAGTLQPSVGQIERQGRVTAILELGAGFHPDFTGRENLYFAGSLIGIDHAQMRQLEPSIIEFAQLHEAMDRPVKTYSSGMTVRLAFALVTAVQPDVLIVDEALAVGDQNFQKKCIERILQFRAQGCTILFCSHSPYHIRHLCDTAIWLDQGQVQLVSDAESALVAYDLHLRQQQTAAQTPESAQTVEVMPSTTSSLPEGAAPEKEDLDSSENPDNQSGNACIVDVQVANLGPADAQGIRQLQGQDLQVTITVRGQGDERPHIGFMLEQSQGVGITSLATHEDGAVPVQLPNGLWRSVLTFPDLPLHSGTYVISAFVFDASGLVVYEQWFQFLHFRFIFPKPLPGLVRLPHVWS